MNELESAPDGAAKWQAPTPPPTPAAPVSSDASEFPAPAVAGWQPLGGDKAPEASEFPAAPAAGLEAPSAPAPIVPEAPASLKISKVPVDKESAERFAASGDPSFLWYVFAENKDGFTDEEATALLIRAWENVKRVWEGGKPELIVPTLSDGREHTKEENQERIKEIDAVLEKLRTEGYHINRSSGNSMTL